MPDTPETQSWEALADTLFGGGQDSEIPDPDPNDGGNTEGGDPDPQDKPNGASTPPASGFTPEELNQAVENRIREMAADAERTRGLSEIEKLILEGDPADIGERVKAEYQEQLARGRSGAEVTDGYASEILDAILTPEFIESLTDEEAAQIDPDKFTSDASYFAALTDLKAARAGRASNEEAFNARVEEAVTARLNQSKGQQLRSPSAGNIPASTGETDAWSSMKPLSSDRLSAIWEEATSGH